MCGIAGVLDRSGGPACADAARRMGAAIAHRGPDDDGLVCDGPVALVNRRLAILDRSPRGHMPMATPDGRHVITYNGELYNFRELRAVLERFNGMFALAVWDRERRSLFLARDRYGVKPLYYAQAGRTLLFGSEVKALLAHGTLRAAVSPEHLLEYLTFQNLFTDGTLFAGVRLLAPGHHLTVACDGAVPA